jgi:hypothetical protein
MLCRDIAHTQCLLQFRYIQPDDCHHQGECNCREQIQVLSSFVECRRVLENAEPASTQRHQAEPLHDDEVDKVHAGGLVQACGEVVRVEIGWRVDVPEPELTEGDAVALEVPICHCERGDSFQDADEPIGLEHELPVDEPVDLGLARLSEENVGFRGLVCEDGRSGTICEAAFMLLATARGVWREVDNTK